jgi:hypothetical protein
MNLSESTPASYGTDVADPPALPVSSSEPLIIFEWVALLPLAIYLASSRLSHQLVGQTALAGFISISLFPRLGALNTIADFLREGADFLDCASSVSELRRTVWDANWGSIFPCANGAASDILTKHALRGAPLVDISENWATSAAAQEAAAQNTTEQEAETSAPKAGAAVPETGGNTGFRRYQLLHILQCSLDSNRREANAALLAKASRLGSTSLPIVVEVLFLLVILGVSVLTILFIIYGTAAAIFITMAFRISRQLIRVTRPAIYFENNEPDAKGCMLVAIHENASTWYLYKGSRAVVDTLLNKPMIDAISARPNAALALTLRVLAALQLVVMTYVAAQKGWDGVGLLVLVAVAWTLDYLLYNEDRLAALWLERECVAIRARSFRFSGRTPMLGVIQVLKGTAVTSWMDGILAPSSRRAVWLAQLNGDTGEAVPAVARPLNQADIEWVNRNKTLTDIAVATIRGSTEEENEVDTEDV